MGAETHDGKGGTGEGHRSLTAILSRALEWGALRRKLRTEATSAASLHDRDVVALGLIAQIVEAETVFCVDPELAESMPAPAWLRLCPLSNTSILGSSLILAHAQEIRQSDLALRAAAGAWIVIHGIKQALPVPNNDVYVRPLAMLNPAFWNSDLAFLAPENQEAADLLSERLRATLGDQSLDALELYEEVCRLREAVRAQANQSRTERDLTALRRYVRGMIERAAITERRKSARAKPGAPVDWSAAFLIPPEIAGTARETQLNEAELRARRARIEAEFLRGQLRSVTIPREVDHHDLIAGSGFFDIAWYAEMYNVPPEETIRHYLEIGHLQELDPSPYFSTSAYFAAYPDVRKHGFNPLLHYLMDGIYEGRAIDPPETIGETIWLDGLNDD